MLSASFSVVATAATNYAPGDPYIYISNQELGQHNIYFHDGVGAHGSGGFGLIDSDNKRTPGLFQSYFPSKAQNAFTGDNLKKIPNGVTKNVYSLKVSSNAKTTLIVSSFLSGVYHQSEQKIN